MSGFFEKYRMIVSFLLIGALAIGTILLLRRNTTADGVQIPIPTVTNSQRPKELKAYVTGAVRNPGVYVFEEGDRVEKALEAAGGPNAEADLSQINLALKLRDEMQVTVPTTIPTVPTNYKAPDASAKININSASGPELESLPKIGPVTAKKITDFRQKNGPFRTTEELVEKKLVPQSTYDAIRDLVEAR